MQVEIEPPFVVVRPVASEEEFYGLADEDSGWELLDGRLVMSPASERHEDLFGFLATLLRGFADARGGAVVRGSRYPMRLDPRWSPEPDLLVVLDRHRHRLTPQRLEGPADLVVEIASDGDPGLDRREKLPRYREAGVPEIWLIEPRSRTVTIEVATAGAYRARTLHTGRLDSTVLPGFRLDVDWLWSDVLPSSFDCLRRVLGV